MLKDSLIQALCQLQVSLKHYCTEGTPTLTHTTDISRDSICLPLEETQQTEPREELNQTPYCLKWIPQSYVFFHVYISTLLFTEAPVHSQLVVQPTVLPRQSLF